MSTSPESTPLIREVRRHESAITVVLAGEIDLQRTPDLLKQLSQLVEERPSRLILDLQHVSYMDSSAVGTLVKLYREVKAYEGKFILVALQQWVRNLLEITKLDRFFLICASEDEALQA